MASSQTPIGFTVREFYTRIIPGTVILATFIVPFTINAYWGETPLENPFGLSHTFLLFGIVSLVLGEIVNTVRELATTPHWFKLFVYEATGETSVLGRRQRLFLRIWPSLIHSNIYQMNEIQRGIEGSDKLYDVICADLGFESKAIEPSLLYIALMNHMDDKMSSLTKRHQINYILAENVWLSLIYTVILQMIVILLSFVIEMPIPLVAGFILITLATVVLISLWPHIYTMTSDLYRKYLLVDYFDSREKPARNNVGYD